MADRAEYRKIDSVGIITFNRPEVRNAIDHRMAQLVSDMAQEAEADKEIGALIVTGAGDRAFCSGMDLKEAALLGPKQVGLGHIVFPENGLAGLTQRKFTKPIIAAVNGAAVAGGCEIALSCDVIIAQEDAIFALPEVKRGLYAFAGGVQRSAKLMPRSEAMAFILSGAPVAARRFHDLGVVSQLVPQGESLIAAQAFCKTILGNSWAALRAAKALFELSMDVPLDHALSKGVEQGFAVFASDDAEEGINAYVEGRAASF